MYLSSQGLGGGKLVHFPVLLPLPVGLPSFGPAGGGDLWEMPAGVLQEAPRNVGEAVGLVPALCYQDLCLGVRHLAPGGPGSLGNAEGGGEDEILSAGHLFAVRL